MIHVAGSSSSACGRIIICSLLHYGKTFDCLVGGLSNSTYRRGFESGCVSFSGIRLGVDYCGGLRRGSSCVCGSCDHKPGWGLLSRNTSIFCKERRLPSRRCHGHTAQGFCSSSLLKRKSEKNSLKGSFEIYSELKNLEKRTIHGFLSEGRQLLRKVEGGSEWSLLSNRKYAATFLNRASTRSQKAGGSLKNPRQCRILFGLNEQKSDSQNTAFVPQASKEIKSKKKAVLSSHKSSERQATKAELKKETISSTNHSDIQIMSETSHNFYHSEIVGIPLTEGTAKSAGSFAVAKIIKPTELSNTSEDMEDSVKKPFKKKKYTPEAQLRFELDTCSKTADFQKAIELYEKTVAEGQHKFNQYHYNVVLYLCSSAALGVLEPKKSGRDNSHQATKKSLSESEPDDTSKGELDSEQNGSISEVEGFGGSMAGLVGKNVMGLTKEMMDLAEKNGFRIYQDMCHQGVPRNEATFTAVARLAVARADGDLAFQMVKEMTVANISPRLRSYGPALYTYYKKKDIEKAFEVDTHMLQSGIMPEESELQVLLRLSVEAGLQEKVYSLLHRLRTTVRDLASSTIDVIEKWFNSKAAKKAKIPSEALPTVEGIRSAMVSRGGGWHGLGWLGSGRWKVEKTNIDKNGFCGCCGEQLVTIDIDPQETEKFQQSLATLACERAHCGNNFNHFQDWLDQHGPFDFVVDAANVGMYNQNFQGAGFNIFQVNAVVTEIQRKHPLGKLPLTILHHKRANGARATSPLAQRLLNEWSNSDAFYSTPTGSNDDWYWLYAAVRNKCLIVTNDEMRDHLFQLLGKDFFPKWKERHQVRFTLTGRGANFHMPPPYSIVIQESEDGSWHIPKSGGDDVLSPREWLCITRPRGMDSKPSLSEPDKNLASESCGKKRGSSQRSTGGEGVGSHTIPEISK
ncbi:hypothetical protein O6H91_01G116700 [Diphasiastrum complanatum]|uniref:Uncharacterized protein n=1 Tax=Diphasiastrum complanatum TaxID=34168 RepID=A0ACC2EVA8_DIPCM|nr:hypothetical protein O6H91_01G116700 [Diphasiastrum complanatum]